MTRDERTADLTLHGWLPNRYASAVGIFNQQLGIGFGVRTRLDPEHDSLRYIGEVVRFISRGDIVSWDLLTDDILNKIDARLSKT